MGIVLAWRFGRFGHAASLHTLDFTRSSREVAGLTPVFVGAAAPRALP